MLTGPAQSVQLARKLRRNLSLPEAMLWQRLRLRPAGIKFRRQHPAGRYVLDFFCAQSQLAVEIDGRSHDSAGAPEHDMQRDGWLLEQGITVLRVSAGDVMTDLDGVVAGLVAAAVTAAPLHRASARSPSPGGGGSEGLAASVVAGSERV
jgi:very-short-patch-repair endonuclease